MTAADLRTIEIARIDASERLRPVDPAYVEVIAASMAQIGLTEPITVRPDPAKPGFYLLVAGAHRFFAAKLVLGWTEIAAILTPLRDAEARLVEIDENLMRRELGALDRAVFLAERKRLWETAHPFVKNGGDPKTKKKQRDSQMANLAIWNFSKETSERTGLSERTVRRAVALVADLSPDVIARIRGTYLEDHASDLEKLAGLHPDEQDEIAERFASGEIKRLSEHRPPARVSAEQRQMANFLEAWSRMSSKERLSALREIGAVYRTRATADEKAAFDASFAEAAE